MDSDYHELCQKVPSQPNKGTGTGIKKPVYARGAIMAVSAEDIADNTQIELQDARTGLSHSREAGMESLYRHFDLEPKKIPVSSSGHLPGISLPDIEDCSFDFFHRSSQNDYQACNASGSQDDLLTDEGLHAASTVSSLSLQGNSMLHSKSINPQNNRMEEELQVPLSSNPLDTPVHDNLGLKRLKGHLKTGKFGSDKDSAKQISGAERANIEMSQGSSKNVFDWESVRKKAQEDNGYCAVEREKDPATRDSVNWEAVRCAKLEDIAETIRERGMNNVLAGRIKAFLERLHREHGSIDLEWLKNVPPDTAKDFLLSIRGLGLKSVECIRLLALQNLAFPVDTNVGRICVRLGWVPIQPLPESLQLHLLEQYPMLPSIQKYLWPRLCTLDQRTLYELHYQMITFGKVFCTKSRPNCNACPMRADCKHFASAFASARLRLPAPNHEASGSGPSFSLPSCQRNEPLSNQLALLPLQQQNEFANPFQFPALPMDLNWQLQNCEPIIEEPATPEHEDIEHSESAVVEFSDTDPDETPSIDPKFGQLASQIFTLFDNSLNDTDAWTTSKALVPLPPEAASIPLPKLKNVSRLRTEHQVYEIPDNHRLLYGLDGREEDDPCPYLLAIWGPGETLRDCEPCGNSHASDKFPCEEENCNSCMNTKDFNENTIKGTLLIPCRTAMRGSFPLNGTYFQVNEVFADHETSMHPLEVPRTWIWNLKRCTVYFGTSIPAIFRGLTTEAIQACFWKDGAR